MSRPRPVTVRLVAAVLVAAILPVAVGAAASVVSASPSAPAPAAQVSHRRSHLELDLVSRTFNDATDNWTIVVLGILDSNAACIPAVFDCIFQPRRFPTGASLTDLDCQSPWWNHLVLFRNHCLKQLFHAGYGQTFLMTYTTDPGVQDGTVTLSAEFGRGVLPVVFQRLALASLTVDLDVPLDTAKSCPDTVEAGGTITCELTVDYPDDGSGGPPVAAATITDVEPAGGEFDNGALTFASGVGTVAGDWDCAAVTACQLTGGATLVPGDSAVFQYQADVDPTADGEVENTSQLDYNAGAQATDTDTVTIAAPTDAVLSITKEADRASARPGETVTWSVVVTNEGGPGGASVAAQDAVVYDDGVDLDAVTMSFVSGVGSWDCSQDLCVAQGPMPVGSATFSVTGTVPATATSGSSAVNEVEVAWDNGVYPDPAVAGASVTVQADTPGTTTTVPAGGAPLSFVG